VIGKVLAGVFTSKTQEHLIFTTREPWKHFPEAISRLAKKKSCRMNVDNSRSIAQQLAEVFIYFYPTFSWKHLSSYFPAITPPSPFREISVHMLSALATTHLEAQMEQERKVIKDPHLAM
jgi:hypothetical protein